MFKSYALHDLFTAVLPHLKHGNDGLVFTPVNFPYQAGTCSKLCAPAAKVIAKLMLIL